MCKNTREKKLRHRLPTAGRRWDSVTASERGERQSDSQWRQGGSFESNLFQGPYWRPHTALYGHL